MKQFEKKKDLRNKLKEDFKKEIQEIKEDHKQEIQLSNNYNINYIIKQLNKYKNIFFFILFFKYNKGSIIIYLEIKCLNKFIKKIERYKYTIKIRIIKLVIFFKKCYNFLLYIFKFF